MKSANSKAKSKTRKPGAGKSENLKPRHSSGEQPALYLVQETSPARPRPGKSTGRKKRSKPALQLVPAKPGQGVRSLRDSINSIVSAQSDRLARALYDKALAGNAPSARLLVELSGDPPAEDAWDGPSISDLFSYEPPQCVGNSGGIIQTSDGTLYRKVENLDGFDVEQLPFGDPNNPNDPRRLRRGLPGENGGEPAELPPWHAKRAA